MKDARLTLAIALPHTTRPTTVEWAVRLATLAYPLNTSYVFIMTKDLVLDQARTALAKQAIKMDTKYIFFLDDDTIPPISCIKRLMSHLARDPEIMVAGGLYPTREDVQQPVMFRRLGEGPEFDWTPGEVFDADVIGGGCMMIKTEVFEHIQEPWFNTGNSDEDGQRNKWTEDTYFCTKVKEAGFRVICDTNVLCDHFDALTGKKYSLQMEKV